MDVNTITLEDERDYIIIETVNLNNNNYLILVAENDKEKICVRKVLIDNNEEIIVKLDSDAEFESVMTELNKKHIRSGENNEE